MRPEEINKTTYSTPKALEIYTTSYLWPYEEFLFDKYVKPGMKIIDIGCGTGRSTHFLKERGAHVVGVDMVEDFIKKGQEMYPSLDLRVMNATSLDFPDNHFDFVFFSNQGIDYSDRREEILKEAYRVTKSGAIFVYSSHNSLAFPRTRKAWVNFIKNLPNWRPGYHFRVEHHHNGDLYVAHVNIWSESKVLRNIGFSVIDILSNNYKFPRWPKLLTGFFTRWPMFVCRKI